MHKAIVAAACLCVLWGGQALAAASKAHATAKMSLLGGAPAGSVDFAQTAHGVLIRFELHGLVPGAHAIHIHTSGNCDPKVKFTSAGPHFSPESKMHGYMAKGGPHPGDLPNQVAASDGTLRASVISTAFALGNGKKSIFDRDGASIIVHAGADDYASQPSGNSGDRVACGVIVRTAGPNSRKGAKRKTHA